MVGSDHDTASAYVAYVHAYIHIRVFTRTQIRTLHDLRWGHASSYRLVGTYLSAFFSFFFSYRFTDIGEHSNWKDVITAYLVRKTG